jgi:CRISPR/Cas system-associated protein Cas10 (large subunit of type III CRISPR-Cas system)
MSVGSLCQVCESASATHSCEQCGRLVCDRHYEQTEGICTVCSSGTQVGDDVDPVTGPGADDAGPGSYR